MADAPSLDAPFDALVRAMNDPRRELVAAAFAEDAGIDRYDADADALVDRHRGHAEIERWLRRTPSQYKFARVGAARERAAGQDDAADTAAVLEAAAAHDHGGEPAHGHQPAHEAAHGHQLAAARRSSYRPGAPIWVSEYAIRSDDFANGGHWHLQLGDDGRITWMRHHPFALRP